jgi:NDP-sugar pyrophosphorylase family protein
MASPVKVFILAGGLGTRIRPLFPDCPKPLIPFDGKPFLQWQIELLAQQGFEEFVLCVGYLSEQIIACFGDGSSLGVQIEYSIESTPLGTGGALKYAAGSIDNTIMLLNGDTYLNTNYVELVNRHQELVQRQQAIGSMSLVYRADTDRYGSVILTANSQIAEFHSRSPDLAPGLVNAGAYVFEPQILDFIPANQQISLEADIFTQIVKNQQNLYGIPIDGTFIDMGTVDGYNQLLTELNCKQ